MESRINTFTETAVFKRSFEWNLLADIFFFYLLMDDYISLAFIGKSLNYTVFYILTNLSINTNL